MPTIACLPACLLLALAGCHSVSPPAPQLLNWNADDSAHVAWLETYGRRIEGKQVVKTIYVPGKLVNLVVR